MLGNEKVFLDGASLILVDTNLFGLLHQLPASPELSSIIHDPQGLVHLGVAYGLLSLSSVDQLRLVRQLLPTW